MQVGGDDMRTQADFQFEAGADMSGQRPADFRLVHGGYVVLRPCRMSGTQAPGLKP